MVDQVGHEQMETEEGGGKEKEIHRMEVHAADGGCQEKHEEEQEERYRGVPDQA